MMRFLVPLHLVNPLNKREHWRTRAKRVSRERDATAWASCAALGASWFRHVKLPVSVTIIMQRPRLFDSDGVPGACKGVRDQLASMLGITDGPLDVRATWHTEQRKGPYIVEVCIE